MAKTPEEGPGAGFVGMEYVGTADPMTANVGRGANGVGVMTGGRDGCTRAHGVTTGSTASVEWLSAWVVATNAPPASATSSIASTALVAGDDRRFCGTRAPRTSLTRARDERDALPMLAIRGPRATAR